MIIGKNGPVAEFFITQYPKDPSSAAAPSEATSITLFRTTSNESYNKSTGSFTVTANGTFLANSDASFIKVERVGNTVKYTVEANPSTTQRTGKINITGYYGVMATFTITQAGKIVMPKVILSSSGASHPYYQCGGSFTVSCMESWSAVAACSFIGINRNGNTINYTVSANTSSSPRTGKILITGRYGIMEEYTVTQAGKPA